MARSGSSPVTRQMTEGRALDLETQDFALTSDGRCHRCIVADRASPKPSPRSALQNILDGLQSQAQATIFRRQEHTQPSHSDSASGGACGCLRSK